MHVTFRQLRLFLALADTGSVGGAARAMHVTQPTASMQLREVAESVGTPLYEVVSRRVRLTEAGEALARTARAMFDEWSAFEQTIDGLHRLTRGRLRLAVVNTAQYFVPRLLGSFCAAYPQVEIALELLNRDAVIARLRDNRDDLYIMSLPPDDIELEDRILMPNPLVVIAAGTHPLAGRRRVTLQALSGERFILRERGSGTRLATDAHFRTQGFVPHVRLELGSNEAIQEAVAGGLGISVVSRHALGPRADGRLVELPVPGFPIRSQWHLVRPRSRRLSPIAAEFERHAAQLPTG